MIQQDLFPVAPKGVPKNRKYDHVKPILLQLRRDNRDLSAPKLIAIMQKMGVSPLPVTQTISVWCREAGMPITHNPSIFPKELKERVISLRLSGLSHGEVCAILEKDLDNCPPRNWITGVYSVYTRKQRQMRPVKLPAAKQVENLLRKGVIGINEAWDALTERGMDEDKALAWVMKRFTGGDGKIMNESVGSGKTFDIAQRRWAA